MKRALTLPAAAGLALCAGAWPLARGSTGVLAACLGAGGALLAWSAVLLVTRRGRTFTLELQAKKQHWLQACAQGSILVYWGWYWRPVYEMAPLIAAQLAFAYGFDALLSYSRRGAWVLGFGPFPVVFSINLFLWFKPDWFWLQFLMIAVGFAAKEFIKWEKQGRAAHIFNPSSFPLALFSVGLLLTSTSDLTLGHEIANTQFLPPHIYLFIFLVALPGQLFFGVTLMTMSAVLTTYLFGVAWLAATGTYFFIDTYVPIAVFLGMHLLFTDPSTAPETEAGRVIFGVLYGLSACALYALLTAAGAPTFYDKLLQVPLLNLAVRAIDRFVRARGFGRASPGMRRHLAYISVWVVAFVALSLAQGVGDEHPGQHLPFWQKACAEGRRGACEYLQHAEGVLCDRGSAWACNELGLQHAKRDLAAAVEAFQAGCELTGYPIACSNFFRVEAGRLDELERAPPSVEDLPILLATNKGPVTERGLDELYARACLQGWADACAPLSLPR